MLLMAGMMLQLFLLSNLYDPQGCNSRRTPKHGILMHFNGRYRTVGGGTHCSRDDDSATALLRNRLATSGTWILSELLSMMVISSGSSAA